MTGRELLGGGAGRAQVIGLLMGVLTVWGCGSDSGMGAPAGDFDAVAGQGAQGTSAEQTAVMSPGDAAPAAAGGSTFAPDERTPSGVDAAPAEASGNTSTAPPLDTGAPIDTGAAPADGDMFCDALSVVRTACQSCHGEELVGGAPMPLVNYQDFMAPAVSDPNKQVHELIGPRLHDSARPMPPLSQAPLATGDVGKIDAWLAAGAPSAATACAAAPAPPAEDEMLPWPEDCEEFYEIRAGNNGQPHMVPADTEQELDFMIPVPWADGGGGQVQALAIRPITNNKRVVHHWILYAGSFDFITSWSPGKPMEVFPEGVGVHMPASGTFRLDMHYYNIGNDKAEPDDSGLEVCITRNPRQYTATTYMFTGNASAPAASRVENETVCDVVASEPVHLITSSPHMHQYGVHARLEILRPDGSVEVLEDAPFNWEDQHVTPIDAVVQSGDRIRITCVYENNTERNVSFGPSSEDEMCFNFARYYPMDAFRCSGGGLGGGLGGGAAGAFF